MHSMHNLRRVDLNLLVVLDALLRERHVSRAAAWLNMSQPAVSHALARLRQLLDDPLFLRQGGGLVPTVRALELTRPLAEALAAIRTVLGPDGFDPTTSRHLFRIAMSDYGSAVLLPKLVPRLRQRAPGVDLVVTQLSREAMVAAVADGSIDLALGVFPQLPDRIAAAVLFQDHYTCLLDARYWPEALDIDRYLAASHVLVAVHGEISTELDQAIHDLGHHRRVAVILPHWSVAPQTVLGTDLILTVARRSLKDIETRPPLSIRPAPLTLPDIRFTAIHHRGRSSDPALRWLLAEIGQALAIAPSPETDL